MKSMICKKSHSGSMGKKSKPVLIEKKRSQVTIFIILGIVLIIIAGVVLMLLPDKPEVETVDPEVSHISGFVSGCLEEVARPSIELAGMQGGRIALPEEHASTADFDVAYGYYLGDNTLASRRDMEQEISADISGRLLECIANFSSFPGKDIEFETPETDAKILQHKVVVETDFPVEVDGKRMHRFSAEVPLAVGRTHSTAESVIEKIKDKPDWLDLTYLSTFDGVKVNLVPSGTDTMLYFLLDDTDYLFVFASKLDLNSEPVLSVPAEIEVKDGEPWLYTVQCTDPDGDPVVIEDDTAMLETLEDGSILSTPEIPGEYDVTFRCSDDHYNVVEKSVLIRVIE